MRLNSKKRRTIRLKEKRTLEKTYDDNITKKEVINHHIGIGQGIPSYSGSTKKFYI